MNQRPDWTEQARAALDDSAQSLDAATLSRLNQARQRALAEVEPAGARRRAWPRHLAVAASLLLAAVLWWPGGQQVATTPASATLSPEDAELLAEEGELEMTDDLEFYAWLDADDEHNG